MKLCNFFFLSFIAFNCTSKRIDESTLVGNRTVEPKKFNFDLNRSPYLLIDVLINERFKATFIIDNGTDQYDTFTLDRTFARENLLEDTSYLSEIHYSNDSILSVQFDSFLVKQHQTPIADLPKRENLEYNGIVGLGFIKNYLLEINYEEQYFSFHKKMQLDSINYKKYILSKKGLTPEIDISFFKNGTEYKHSALLDLGFGKEGFLWGGAATRQLPSSLRNNLTNSKAVGVKAMNGMYGTTADIYFDSVKLFKNLSLKNNLSTLLLSGNGFFMTDQIWFGNDILKNFGKIYFDFESNHVYLPK